MFKIKFNSECQASLEYLITPGNHKLVAVVWCYLIKCFICLSCQAAPGGLLPTTLEVSEETSQRVSSQRASSQHHYTTGAYPGTATRFITSPPGTANAGGSHHPHKFDPLNYHPDPHHLQLLTSCHMSSGSNMSNPLQIFDPNQPIVNQPGVQANQPLHLTQPIYGELTRTHTYHLNWLSHTYTSSLSFDVGYKLFSKILKIHIFILLYNEQSVS